MVFKKITLSTIVVIGLIVIYFKSATITYDPIEYRTASTVDAESYEPIVVLELFTSQGCSSCPPADALLDKVKNEFEHRVIPMSYHVDYWNYIGWEDPFSKSRYSEKQRKYNIKFKSRSNYTPQVVVNGKEHFIGSNTSKLYGAINRYRKEKTANHVELKAVSADENRVLFEYALIGGLKGKGLRAALVLDQRKTQVKRGENRNRTLKNSNIVIAEKNLAIDGNEGQSFMAIPEIIGPDEKISLILLLENSEYNITGAAKSVVAR